MASQYTLRMTARDYSRCLDEAARATAPETVQRLRDHILERWRGDPRAADLAETLYVHQERLAARETPLGSEIALVESRAEARSGRRTG